MSAFLLSLGVGVVGLFGSVFSGGVSILDCWFDGCMVGFSIFFSCGLKPLGKKHKGHIVFDKPSTV